VIGASLAKKELRILEYWITSISYCISENDYIYFRFIPRRPYNKEGFIFYDIIYHVYTLPTIPGKRKSKMTHRNKSK